MKKLLPSRLPNQWVTALIVAATALTGASFFYGVSQFGRQERSATVATAPQVLQVTALGRLEPVSQVVSISVPATLSSDRVAQLLIAEGDMVQAGQVIAVLSSRDRLQTALIDAQRGVEVARARLAQVNAGAKSGEITAQNAEIARLEAERTGEIATQQAAIVRWESEVRKARADLARYQALYQAGATSASELDQRRLALETSQAQLNQARANQNRIVQTLEKQIQQAKATLNQIAEVRPVDVEAAQAEVNQAIAAVKQAETAVNDAVVRAPIAGRILKIHARAGEAVGNRGIADLGQTDQMEVVAEVYQTDIAKVQQGQSATVTSDSFTGTVKGAVRLVGLQVTQQEVASGTPGENLDQRVVEVRIRLHPEDSRRVANFTNLQVQVAIQI